MTPLRTASANSARAANRLSGDRGRRLAPLLVDFVVADDDNSAAGLDPGDTLTLVFDVPTDVGVSPPQPWGSGVGEGATSGGVAYVDSLFRFCDAACPDDADTSTASLITLGAAYSGQWSDESTFVVTIVDPTGSEISLGETVGQARPATADGAAGAGANRRARFRGGISDFSNATSPALRGTLGSSAAPTISAFVARDADHADTSYGAFDELSLQFSFATDRGMLPVLSGDKRFVDRYFEFACNLGLDYSGAWDDPTAATITILDGTVGHSPQALVSASTLGELRVTPSPNAAFRNKPGLSAIAPSAVLTPQPPLRGSEFPAGGGTRLCDGVQYCDFGDFGAPQLVDTYVGDLDNSGSWSTNDQLTLTFDRPTNRLVGGGVVGGGVSLDREALFSIFSFRAVNNLGSLDAADNEWRVASGLAATWRDTSTLVIDALYINASIPSEQMPDPTQCGLVDDVGDPIICPGLNAMGASTGVHQSGLVIPAGSGFKLRVDINASAGLRTESNSPLAAPAGGSVDFQLSHCYSGVLVATATMRDPDNLDTAFSNGDEIEITFNVETDRPPVAVKWDIDRLLTFCTPCNPSCERSQAGAARDAAYNGLGTEYSGTWTDRKTLVITMLNVTLPADGLCYSNTGGDPTMPFGPANTWRVMTSYSATQASMLLCGINNGPFAADCVIGENDPNVCPYNGATYEDPTCAEDLSGNRVLQDDGRMFGPRYPHKWISAGVTCDNYMQYWLNYQTAHISPTGGVYDAVAIGGSVGPVGVPAIAELRASDPDDLDLAYGAGDELTVVFGIATDRSNGTQFGNYAGDRLYVDSLFAFNAQLGQDYSGAWSDDSTFVLTVVDPSWRVGPPFGADGRAQPNNCTAGLRAGVSVRNLASTSAPLNAPSPPLSGDVGLDAPPLITRIIGDDPDDGDVTVAYGDRLTISLSIATDRGCASTGVSSDSAACPYAIGALIGRDAVDTFFNFSVALGNDYAGTWRDDSTFVISITDGTGSELNAQLGSIIVNPTPNPVTLLGNVMNQGCRPGVYTRSNALGLCNPAVGFFGPILSAEDAPADALYVASFGVSPRVVSISVSDPDRGDSHFGNGDAVTVVFDQATDRAVPVRGVAAGDKAYVDALMSFSMPLGLEYIGQWADDSTFVATVVSMPPFPIARATFEAYLGSATTFVALDTVPDNWLYASEWAAYYAQLSVTLNSELRDVTSLSRASRGMAPATNDESRLRSLFPVYESTTPNIINVTAEDVDQGDSVYGMGDVLRVTFNMPTDRGAVTGSRAFVDRLLRFDPPIGTDYTGAWASSTEFIVRALDTVGGELLLCNHVHCTPSDQSNVTLVGTLRNLGGTSPVAASSAHLEGVSGDGAPELRLFEVSDPNNGDYVFSADDQVTITFDRSTDLGAVEAKRRRVDALFSFNIPLGEDYSGQWRDDSVFAITITNTRYDLPLINQTIVTPIRSIRAANGTSVPASNAGVTLHGHFGRARRPRLERFAVKRKRRALGIEPGPPLYQLTFNEPTNRTCAFCFGNDSAYFATANPVPWSYDAAKAAVDELFSFSVLLGGAYSGEWADATTFEVTVLDVLVNTTYGETPAVGRARANFTGLTPLFDRPGRLPASTTESIVLEGDANELVPEQTDILPTPILPRVASFLLLDGGDGGLRADGTFGANATLLLTFNLTAHNPIGDTWRHEFVDENVSSAFPGGVWALSDEYDPYSGVFSDTEGLQFSQSIGDVYEGVWLTREQLRITLLQPGAHTPRVNLTSVRTSIGGRTTDYMVLSTNIGSTVPPAILSAVADDPDSLDYVYSSGDTVSIAFSTSTDRAGGAQTGNKAYVDSLFSFTQTLAYDYSGEWLGGITNPDSLFQITIVQATCPGCTPMVDSATNRGATVRPHDTAFIKTRAGSSPRASAPSPPLVGNYGLKEGPRIVSFVADDFDNGDDVYGSGDTLTVVFDLATNRGGADERATSVNVDNMLVFSQALGSDINSQWSDDSTLVVTVTSPAGAGDVLVGRTTVLPQPTVRNKGCCAEYTPAGCAAGSTCCCYDAITTTPVALQGDFGIALPPAIESFVGDDPDDGDAEYGASDVLMVTFDMATNRGRGDPFGGKAWVDDLLWFSLPIGDDYSGEWVEEDKAVRISILQPASTRSSLPEGSYACEQLSGVAPAPPHPPGWHCYDGVPPVAPLNVSDSYWRQTLVSARGDGYDNDGDGQNADVRNRAQSSGASDVPPTVRGQLGNLGTPSIVLFSSDDPNNGDVDYGEGDEITIRFDRPVDRTDVYGGRESVDRLFGFTTPLGEAYRGQWNDTSTFVIRIEDSGESGAVERGATRVHASTRDDAVRLRNRAGCQGAAEESCLMPYVPAPPRLVGDFGVLPDPPRLLSARIQDYDNLDASYSANDTITIRFDRPTDYAGGAAFGGREWVDSLLNFSTPLGNDYAGMWSDDGSDLVVTTVDAGNGTVVLDRTYDENGTVVVSPTAITVIGHVRTRAGNSVPSWANLTVELTGDVGANETACCDPMLDPSQRRPSCCAHPRVVSTVGQEVVRGQEWTVTIGLDRATDRGRTRLPESLCPLTALDRGDRIPQECVMLLFSFFPTDAFTFVEPDANAHGQWQDDSTFIVTTTLNVASPGTKYGETQQEYLQIGTTSYVYTSGLLINGTQHCDQEQSATECPSMTQISPPDVPRLVGFSVEDHDNLDAVLSVGDEYHLSFDVPTDQHLCVPTCRGGPEYVTRLFTFSAQLASDYVGYWRDNSTFSITVTRVDPGFVAPPIAATIAALRPPNEILRQYVEDDLRPWLTQSGVSYMDLQVGPRDMPAMSPPSLLSSLAMPLLSPCPTSPHRHPGPRLQSAGPR